MSGEGKKVQSAPADAVDRLSTRPRRGRKPQGSFYEPIYMKRRGKLYPLSENDLTLVSWGSGSAAIFGSLASFFASGALSTRQGLLAAAGITEAQKIALESDFRVQTILAVIFAALAIGGMLVKRTAIKRVREDCVEVD